MATQMAAHQQFKPIPAARKAEKRQVKLKLGIQGPSGSGKTEGALALASSIWPEAKILLVDTENESASLYADRYVFDTIPLDPPFESIRYEQCISYAVENGYDVLILDSVTHQWDGEGGILRRKEELDRRPGSNSFTNWAALTPEHTHFIEAIKQSQIHVIATLRSKQEYALQENQKGKLAPIKMGMAPIQREGFEYEFSIVFDVQMDHKATVSKNRTGLFDGKVVDLLDKKISKQLREWLDAGKPAESVPTPAVVRKAAPPTPTPTAAKVESWKFDETTDLLSCHVYAIDDTRKTKQGAQFIAIKHNGKVNAKDIAFCFNDKLFDAVRQSADKTAVFKVDPANFVTVIDVVEVDGTTYCDGQPQPKLPFDGPITDDDLPF